MTKRQTLAIARWRCHALLGLCLLLLAPWARGEEISEVSVDRLRCEYLQDPLGIDVERPRLSWWINSRQRGQHQTAYQLLVASAPELLASDVGDLWDSGKIVSAEHSQVECRGQPLGSGDSAFWKVRVWDAHDRPGPYSEPARFEMGLLERNDWQARWIDCPENGSPLFRKPFAVASPVRKARVYLSGLGYYELSLNGQKVGDHVLDPASTYYKNDQPWPLTDRALYVTYDVTSQLVVGENVLGVMLGNGWFSDDGNSPGRQSYADRPRLIAQLVLEYADGHRETLGSGAAWRTAPGPITANEICLGETYDARREQAGWNAPGFDDSHWQPARLAEAPCETLSAQMVEPCRVVQSLPAVALSEPSPGVFVFDFGQHFSGWTQIEVPPGATSEIRLRHAGAVHPDGSLDTRNNLAANQTDLYVPAGGQATVWEPRFTLHGFRYVEVTGYPGKPTLQSVAGRHVRNDVASVGGFSCSHALANQVESNIRWTLAASLQGIPQDAADRHERVGWLGDTGFVANEYFVNFDLAAFSTKWLRDIRDAQRPNGDVPVIAPLHMGRLPGIGESKAWRGAPDWTATYPLFVGAMYWYYGDKRIVAENYDALVRLVDFWGTQARDGILPSVLGDHMEPQDDGSPSFLPKHTPADLTTTCFYFRVVSLMREMAAVLDKPDHVQKYRALGEQIREAFQREFFNASTKSYGPGSQTANALPLAMGVVPPPLRKAVLASLVSDIEKRDDRLSTGIIGTRGVSDALSQAGRVDLMFRITTQTEYPSWGFQINNGATTVWESLGLSDKLSLNMKMFSNASRFLHENVAGLVPLEPGYRRVRIRPGLVTGLEFAEGSQDTPAGRFEVRWERKADELSLQTSIPPGVTAEIWLPQPGATARTYESGTWLNGESLENSAHPGILSANQKSQSLVVDVASGSYQFTIDLSP